MASSGRPPGTLFWVWDCAGVAAAIHAAQASNPIIRFMSSA
jgi:hypothetical protein